MDNEQILYYSSHSNITFHGELETGMTKEEWASLPDSERQEIFTEMLWELVEIGEKE